MRAIGNDLLDVTHFIPHQSMSSTFVHTVQYLLLLIGPVQSLMVHC